MDAVQFQKQKIEKENLLWTISTKVADSHRREIEACDKGEYHEAELQRGRRQAYADVITMLSGKEISKGVL